MKKNKLAQGHIEVMLSFTIFVGFLLFIFIFLNPFAKTQSPQVMRNVQESIINEISGEIGKLSIIVNSTNDCYDNSKVIIYGDNFIETSNNNLRKYTIYYNDVFGAGGEPSCSAELGRNYSIGTYSKEKIVIYEKIEILKSDYTNDYEGLKDSLGILNEFIFELKKIDGGVEIGVNKNIPVGIEIESVNIPMRVINSNGKILEYILNIRTW
jgi:hypothetical protein